MFSLIIPMYNEEKILESTIKTLNEYMSQTFDEYEVIFSDDGSTDQSRSIVENCGCKNFRVVGYKDNRGKGAAVRNGMLSANGDVRLFTDCDLAYGTEIIGKLYNEFSEKDCDVIIGSRNLTADGYAGYTAGRKLASKCYIKLLCAVGGFKLSDSQCGFKAFSKNAAEKVFSLTETDGFAFDFEALMIATRLGFKIGEIPVKIINHREAASKVNMFSDTFSMLRDVSRMKKRIKKQV